MTIVPKDFNFPHLETVCGYSLSRQKLGSWWLMVAHGGSWLMVAHGSWWLMDHGGSWIMDHDPWQAVSLVITVAM
jgi:hypothetical protein